MIIVSQGGLESALATLGEHREFGLDTETYGFRWEHKPFSIILAIPGEEFYFNFKEYPGIQADLVLSYECLAPFFLQERNRYYISDAKFDMLMLSKVGLEIPGTVVCTQAMGRLLKNNYPGGDKEYGLDASARRAGLGSKHDGVLEYILANKCFTEVVTPGKKLKDKDLHFDQVPLELISEYACQDAKLHLELGQWLGRELLQENTRAGCPPILPLVENEIALTKTCFEMQRMGILMDRAYTEQVIAYEEQLEKNALESFRELAGEDFVNSNKALARVFEKAGAEIKLTEKGNPTFTDKILEDLDSPLAESVREIRSHQKLVSTYYSTFLKLADLDDVIHPNMRQGGTETGRFSYWEPNLQNCPKDEEGYDPRSVVRSCFKPRPGFVFTMIDFEQQEFRMMLDYAGEKRLIDDINNGADVHQATADLLGISRRFAKTINFMLLYGGGDAKLAKSLGISLSEAKGHKHNYFSKLPRVENFISQVIGVGRTRGYVFNWFGRRCHVSSSEFAYVLPNHLIQGGGADVIKIAMNRLRNFLAPHRSRMLLQVHDELLFEIHETEFDLVPQIKSIMESVYQPRNGMRLTCSVEHSFKSWGTPDKVKGFPSERII